MSGCWVTGADRGDPAVRLFCFPHAGGGARFFRPWSTALGPDVQVCPIVLPGRESRKREQPHTRIGPLVAELAGALEPYLDRPFAFFGHSLGALVAYETVYSLTRAGLPEPGLLIASGRRAPHLAPRSSALHRLPRDRFVAHLLALGGTPAGSDRRRQVLDLFLPMLRADYEVNETYEPSGAGPLTCPVAAYHGREDPVATPAQVDAWRDTTTGPFRLRLLPGDHFYHKDAPANLVAAIREDLTAARIPAGEGRAHAGVPAARGRQGSVPL